MGKKRATRRGKNGDQASAGIGKSRPGSVGDQSRSIRPSEGNRSLVCYHHSASSFQPAILGQYLVFQLTNNHLLFPFETVLLQCMSPEVMLWTAPPPARERHRPEGAA
jgi:hypothetical protein